MITFLQCQEPQTSLQNITFVPWRPPASWAPSLDPWAWPLPPSPIRFPPLSPCPPSFSLLPSLGNSPLLLWPSLCLLLTALLLVEKSGHSLQTNSIDSQTVDSVHFWWLTWDWTARCKLPWLARIQLNAVRRCAGFDAAYTQLRCSRRLAVDELSVKVYPNGNIPTKVD